MGTWTDLPHTAALLDAAEAWKQRCLLREQSILTNSELWSLQNLQQLRTLFVDNPIAGKRNFYDKLQEQISSSTRDVKKLAAETLWILLLLVSKDVLGAETKRDRIARIWRLSSEDLPESVYLSDQILAGLANPGIAFLTKMWAELGFLLTLMVNWKSLPAEEQTHLITNNPWAFCEWVTTTDEGNIRAFRHILLYLCYPQFFERICSRNHKKQVHASFADKLAAERDPYRATPTLCALDKSIYEIRQQLSVQFGTEQLDFYRPPLRPLWLDDDEQSELEVETAKAVVGDEAAITRRYWVEKTIVRGRVDRQEGDNRVGASLWSPQKSTDGRDIYASMREVAPGDVVFHLTDNAAITGISFVASAVDTEYMGVAGTEWGERPSYRVALEGYQPLTPPLLRAAFFQEADFRNELLKIQADKENGPLFYNKVLELNQGAYFTEAPTELVRLLNSAYEKLTGKLLPVRLEEVKTEPVLHAYTVEDAIEELFIDVTDIEKLISSWSLKKNRLLQGPPGVGKSFAAKRLAFALMGTNEQSRMDMVQFHQSYSYEDFVQGYRPDGSGFSLKNGRFFEFCLKAKDDLKNKYVFIIDEINRGNLSKIFGELMLLIEADKRSPNWEVPLVYSTKNEKFFVPENVFILGLMNTADRSLAVVDYALRRRFSFFELAPQFQSKKFNSHLEANGVSSALVSLIAQRMGDLNHEIGEDKTNLGRGFCIGHSFFCTRRGSQTTEREWYRQIIETEIAPLLNEYWFDNTEKAAVRVDRLLTGF